MTIYVQDGLNLVGFIDTYISVIWNMQYYGLGEFELAVIGTADNIDLLAPGRLLIRDIDIDDNGIESNVMRIESQEVNYDREVGWTLTVRGKGLKGIASQRVIWEQEVLNDTLSNVIETVFTNNLINPSVGDRKIPSLTVGDISAGSTNVECQVFGENVGEWMSSICQTYGIGWDIYIDSGFKLKVYRGANSGMIYSPDFDNLVNATYTDNGFGKNVALVGGEGEGISQVTTTVGSGSGLERFETYVDGSSVSSNGEIITQETYIRLLQNYGNEELANINATNKTFDGSVLGDYTLGDIVTVSNGLVSSTARIIEVIWAEDENGITVNPTFDWEEE